MRTRRLDNYGKILRVIERPNLESHKLIEEFMIAANIVAAETLKNNLQSFLYRVHSFLASTSSKEYTSLNVRTFDTKI